MKADTRLNEVLRFGIVTVAGFAIDLGTAAFLLHVADWPLVLAAGTGFCVAAIINYLAHELFTFRSGARRLSGRRSMRYLMVAAFTLGVRLAAVTLLSLMLSGEQWGVTILLIAAGISLCVNYLLSRTVVFTVLETPRP
tara:strand:+ start:325 stop:741 length:417 start_codon:yes stop_codon:yes gene_type:complete